jgi:murein tripeptide amidase MpaA
VPRISVDGAELYLTSPITLRASVRPYPEEDERAGLKRKDLNGDGFLTLMRVPDANGTWKKSTHDDRLIIKRAPDEIAGEFYHVYPEGELTEPPDGAGVTILRPPYSLDINRNFPANWPPDST